MILLKSTLIGVMAFLLSVTFSPAACCGTGAQAGPAVFGAGISHINLAPTSEYVEDAGGTLTVDEVVADGGGPFRPLDAHAVNFGLRSGIFWFRFGLRNDTGIAQRFFVEVNNPRINLADIYLPNASGGFDGTKCGTDLPFSERAVPDSRPIFPVDLAPGQETICLLRVESRGAYRFGLSAWNQAGLDWHRMSRELMLGLFYGLILAAAVESLVLYAALRDRAFLYLTLMAGSTLLYELVLHGTAHQYFWPSAVTWADQSYLVTAGLCVMLTVLFVREFLDTRLNLPRMDKILLFFAWSGAAMGIGRVLFDYRVNILAHGVAGVGCAAVLGAGIACAVKGYRPALSFLFAWGAMLIGLLISLLMSTSLLPKNFITENGFHVGVAFSMIIFSLAVANRFRILKAQYSARLEGQVQERTRDLAAALQNVKTLRGLVPICSGCKKIRDDQGFWNQLESYLKEHSEADLTHGLCPECTRKLYGKEYGTFDA